MSGHYGDFSLVLNARNNRNHRTVFPPCCRCVQKAMSCHAMSFLQHVLPSLTPPPLSPRNTPARTILLRFTNQPLPAVFSLRLGLQLQRRHSTCSHTCPLSPFFHSSLFRQGQSASQHYFSGIPTSESSPRAFINCKLIPLHNINAHPPPDEATLSVQVPSPPPLPIPPVSFSSTDVSPANNPSASSSSTKILQAPSKLLSSRPLPQKKTTSTIMSKLFIG